MKIRDAEEEDTTLVEVMSPSDSSKWMEQPGQPEVISPDDFLSLKRCVYLPVSRQVQLLRHANPCWILGNFFTAFSVTELSFCFLCQKGESLPR